MRKALLLTAGLLLVASMAFAQGGSIGLFADVGATVCDVYDVGGIVYIYVVHVYCADPGALGSRFMVDWYSWGNLMTKLSETVTPPYLGIGTTEGGISVAYINCMPCPNMLITTLWLANGLSSTCSYAQVMADPTHPIQPGIYVIDCWDNEITATGGDIVINPDATCMCNVPVEDTSWGQIKALYQ